MREGLEGNLCRCTGYHNIVKAVLAAAGAEGGPVMTAVVGTRMVRKEDPELLTGEGRYVDDLVIPGARWLGMVRSPYAHARITTIDASAAARAARASRRSHRRRPRDWHGPRRCRAPGRHRGHEDPEHFPVALDEAVLRGRHRRRRGGRQPLPGRATPCGAVIVDYEPLEAVVDLEDALTDRVVIHDATSAPTSRTTGR